MIRIWVLIFTVGSLVTATSSLAEPTSLGSDWEAIERTMDTIVEDVESRARAATQTQSVIPPREDFRWRIIKNTISGTNKGFDLLGIDIARKGVDFLKAYEALSLEDQEYEPNFDPAGMPQVPSQCVDSNECQQCYVEANDEINYVRYYLEKLYRIGKSTVKMAKKAIAFGDSASGIHGLSGLGWQLGARPEIEKSLQSFQKTYEEKYEVYLTKLETGLHRLSECEAEYFGEGDWYSRFGFIYYSFMKERYRYPG